MEGGGEAETRSPYFVVINPGLSDERWVPVHSPLFIGRVCEGIDEEHRLIIDDPEVSRSHLEIRIDPESGRASVIDSSTNGTYLDGIRLARAHPVRLKSGGRLIVGPAVLEFRSDRARRTGTFDQRSTLRRSGACHLAMAVGDIVEYTTIAERTAPELLAEGLDLIFEALQECLSHEQGSLAHYAGDAFFGVWETERIEGAAVRAVTFALRAVNAVAEVGPSLPFRESDGSPVRMGWGVVDGEASVRSLPGGIVGVVGDATNLAFRLAGIAARGGTAEVLVTESLSRAAGGSFRYGTPRSVVVKGRQDAESVREVLGVEDVGTV